MIEMVLAHSDLARARFAHSPLRELVTSLRVLQHARRQDVYRRWRSAVSGRLGHIDMQLLTALAPTGPYLCSFLFPPIPGPSAVLADELDAVAATSPGTVRDQLDPLAGRGALPRPLRPLYEDPVAELSRVVKELDKYWLVALEPFWQQIQNVVTADLFYRMDQFASGGVAKVFDHLHPEVSFNDDWLGIEKPHHCTHRYDLTGEGVVLVPCVFTWPTLIVDCCDVPQPSLTYPPRGIADIGGMATAGRTDRRSTFFSRTKVSLLASLKHPKTTAQLARELEISPSAVSQHLKVLKETELAVSRRRGRMVLYQRTASATALLSFLEPDDHHG